MKIVEQSASLLSMTPCPLFLIEHCGRICYKSEERMTCEVCDAQSEVSHNYHCDSCISRATKFVQGILKRGHESVLEHASATFLLVTDRGMTHEIVRHRIASYSQESTRYCNYGNKDGGISVVKPSTLDPLSEVAWKSSMAASEGCYSAMISNGVQPQWARSVLPTCLKTEIAVSANFRQWRHMLKLRLLNAAGKAHPQIIALMRLVLAEFMKSEAAPIFSDIEKSSLETP